MARMHSDNRGSSGSTRPRSPDPSWVDHDPEEVEELVEKLASKSNQPSAIGRILRDRYGIPRVKDVIGKNLTDVLEEREVGPEVPEDLYNLMAKALEIRSHLDKNENDLDAQRNLSLTEAKIRRLANYYRGDELPEDWSYSPETARLIVK